MFIVSDRAATEESKYFELGWQPHEFFLTRNTCSCNIHPILKTINSHSLAEELITRYYTIVFRVCGSENGRYSSAAQNELSV